MIMACWVRTGDWTIPTDPAWLYGKPGALVEAQELFQILANLELQNPACSNLAY
jgi:hypothetical protein